MEEAYSFDQKDAGRRLKKRGYILLACHIAFCLLFSRTGFGQGQNNFWCFGHETGLNFNTSPPALFQHNMATFEGCATASDANGNLLFYTMGNMVWDKNGTPMPNASGLSGNGPVYMGAPVGSSRLGVAVVQSPQNANQYYLFCTDANENNPTLSNLYYSLIDMTLNGGLGDVVSSQKNIVLNSGMSEPLGIALNGDCSGYWLFGQKSASFTHQVCAYEISNSGLNTTPVISTIPFGGSYGFPLLFSAGDSLVVTCTNYITVGSFNKTTGVFSDFHHIDTYPYDPPAQMAFSPDYSKLYAAGIDGIFQYDFSLWPDTAAIAASVVQIDTGLFICIRTAPNGKIYLHRLSSDYLSCINNPDLAGMSCNFNRYAITLPAYSIPPPFSYPTFSEFGNDMAIPASTDTVPGNITDTAFCFETPASLQTVPGALYYYWSTGSTTAATAISQPGTYWVRRNENCGYKVDSFYVSAIAPDTIFHAAIDTGDCLLSPLVLTASGNYNAYLWNTGDTTAQLPVQQPGDYLRYGFQDCKVYVDSFHVAQSGVNTTVNVRDTTVCFQPEITVAPGGSYSSFLWSTGSTDPVITVSGSGTYWRRASAGCDLRSDTFHINMVNFRLDLGPDTSLCAGDTLFLDASVAGAVYLWQDGSGSPGYRAGNSGRYWVRVNNAGCMLSDTIHIELRSDSLFIEPGDTTICVGDKINLTAHTRFPVEYFWSNGSAGPVIEVSQAGSYALTVDNECGPMSDSVRIDIQNCSCIPFLPTAFSPNGDGLNDVFEVKINCLYRTYRLALFNRYGQKIFISNDPGRGWDGTFRNQGADAGVYFYTLKYVSLDGKMYSRKGDVTLVR